MHTATIISTTGNMQEISVPVLTSMRVLKIICGQMSYASTITSHVQLIIEQYWKTCHDNIFKFAFFSELNLLYNYMFLYSVFFMFFRPLYLSVSLPVRPFTICLNINFLRIKELFTLSYGNLWISSQAYQQICIFF